MIDLKQLTGVMNLDNPNDVLPPFHHKHLMNGRFRGNGNNMRVESVPGNVLIPNYFLPAGTNQCIGGFYDSVKRRIIWFNYNSNGRNGIYKFDIGTKVLSKIFLCYTDTATDILRFSLDYPIHSASIVYRSEGDGDLMYWTDGNVEDENRPRYLNLDTVSTQAPFTEDMINAGKNAPLRRPSVSYGSDVNVNVNNLRKKMIRFIHRWVYANGDKSTWSPISKVALPVDGYTPDTQNDPSNNNYIAATVFAGGDDSVSIEVAFQQSEGNSWSDFFLADTLNMDEYNITPDGSYTYNFYNNGGYTSIDVTSTNLYFSWLPDYARTLEVLNGNHIIYANTTDGYPSMERSDVDVTVTTGSSNPNIPTIASQQTDASAVVLFIGSTATVGAVYHVAFDYVSGGVPGSSSINYTTLIGDDDDDIATAIAAALNGGVVQAVFGGSGTVRVTITGTSPSLTNLVRTVSVTGSESAGACWKWANFYRLGIQYFDDRGKPVGGVVSFLNAGSLDETDFGVTTPEFSTQSTVPQVPFIAATVNHTPPTGAVSYQWVRAQTLPLRFIEFVTNDYQSDTNFLYFCIQNITYNDTKLSGFVPSYDFSPGDHLRVMAKYTAGVRTPYNIQLDFEILGVEDRTMTSPASTGKFLKVAKPTTVPSVPYSANMFIEIYTPSINISDDLLIFREWGEQYSLYSLTERVLTYTPSVGTVAVGDTITQATTNATGLVTAVNATTIYVRNVTGTFLPGFTFIGIPSGGTGTITVVGAESTNRYHEGQIQNQTALQAATFQWFDGDVYYKNRTFYLDVGATTTITVFMMDENYSDYFASKVNSNGRGWQIRPDSKTITNGVELRWGDGYLQDTNINELNIFQPTNMDVLDLSKGDILRLLAEERRLYAYQQRGVGSIGVYSRYIKNNQNEQELISTNDLITKNNIYYLQGNWGLQNQSCAVFRGEGNVHYFFDCTDGSQLRKAGDGITNLGELYWGQYTISDLITPYNSNYLRTDGSKAKIMGFFDFFEDNGHFILQGGVYSNKTINSYNLSFNEKRNGYTGFYDYANIDWALSAASITYSWKNGQLYVHNAETSGKWCEFYGVKYYPSITLVFNKDAAVKKTLNALAYQGNQYWVADTLGDILTSQPNQQTGLPQISSLKDFDFDIQEGLYYAGLKRDANSMSDARLALCEGDFLKGVWGQVKLTYKGNDYAFLYSPYLTYSISQRNF